VFERESLEEPAQVQVSDESANGTHCECRTHQIRVSQGPAVCYRPADGSRDTWVGADGVRRGERGSVWEDEEEKEDARWGGL
jgi:hypothetical protein